MKKFVITFFLLFVSYASRGQRITDPNQVVTTWLNIYKNVKNTDEKVTYYLDITSVACTFQILINDVPVLISNEEGNLNGMLFPISGLICNSGDQHITIRMFPAMNDNYQPDPCLSANSRMQIKILRGLDNDKPTVVVDSFSTSEVVGNQKCSIELKREFIAQVPYVLEGWNKGVALESEDREALAKEVVTFYNNLRTTYQTHDITTLGGLLIKRQTETAQAYFLHTQEQSKSSWDKLQQIKNIIKMYPIENDSLAFFGNGKLVTLIRKDPEFRGKSVLIGETEELISVFPIYLYRQASGAALAIIR